MGLLKTAMMSGAAIYGVKQIAKTAEHRSNNKNSSYGGQSNGGDRSFDAEYQDYLEWKRRSNAVTTRDLDQNGESYGPQPPRQQLHLIDGPKEPPSYERYSDDWSRSSSPRLEPMNFEPRQQRSWSPAEGQHTRGGNSGLDVNDLIGQGMSMLQSRDGNNKKNDFMGKLLSK